MLSCLSSYFRKRYCTININTLADRERKILFSYLTLDVIGRFSSPYAAFNPDFEITANRTNRYDERQFYAQVINYLLLDTTGSSKPHRPTLNSLQILVDGEAFGRGWWMSSRTFEKYWRAKAASSPFLYVEQYHSPFDWSLNPQDTDFAQSVDELTESVDSLRAYFGRVRWVIARLGEVLDPRAMRAISFPRLPDQIEAVPIVNPALDARLRAKIAELF